MTRPRRRWLVPLLTLAMAASGAAAWAFWSSSGTGSAAAASASLAAATITTPTSAVNSVTVTWTLQATLAPTAPANSDITYVVQRRLGAGVYAAVTSGACSGALARGIASCVDVPAASGSYSYRVVATFHSWTATSSASGPVPFDDVAPTVQAVLTPAANGAGWNNASPVTVGLSADDGTGSGVATLRYTTDGSSPVTSGTAYTTPLSISATTTIKFYATDLAGNASGVSTQLVKIDTTAPANAVTLSGITGGAFKSGATLYYRGAAAGSFTLTNAVTDASSGPASSATATLSGTSTGWTHSPSTVSTPTGGPYVSGAFSWSAATTSAPGESVTGSDVAGNTTTSALTLTDDSVAPAGGSVDATGLGGTAGRYATSTTLSIAFTPGTDGESGLASSGAQLLRASATLSADGCGTYGGYTQVGSDDPASPVGGAVHTDGTCYRYRYVVPDHVGNQAIYTSSDIKIDTTAPSAPTFGFSALTNAYWSGGASTTVYYRSTASSGSLTATATSTDAQSNVASYSMPTLGSGWTTPSGSTGVQTYAWILAGPAAPAGAQNATATNNAGSTSSAGFTMVSDVTAPTGGSVTYTAGYTSSLSLTVGFAEGTDGGSGLDASSHLLQRAVASLSAGACGTFGAFTTIATNPSGSSVANTVTADNCYEYQYLVSDRVGNQATYGGAIAKIDTAAPTITRAQIALPDGSSPGSLLTSVLSYRVYAQVSDNHAVSAVTSNTSSFDSDAGSSSLTSSGPWTVGGLSYNYRSDILFPDLVSLGTKTYTITATDGAANSAGPTSYSVAFTLL